MQSAYRLAYIAHEDRISNKFRDILAEHKKNLEA
jgi:hypothetical protein